MCLMRYETRLSQGERTASEMPRCKTCTVFHPLTSALKMNKGAHCHRDKLKRRLAHTRGKLTWADIQHPTTDVLLDTLCHPQHAVVEKKVATTLKKTKRCPT